ncbi:catalase-peroxidase domain protein [Desulfosporosinus sp. OT]|nr:catalase-peroxidase domain protein [Desulfosporosinus sp. OT]
MPGNRQHENYQCRRWHYEQGLVAEPVESQDSSSELKLE